MLMIEIKKSGMEHVKIIRLQGSNKIYFIAIDNEIVYKVVCSNSEQVREKYMFIWYRINSNGRGSKIDSSLFVQEFKEAIEEELSFTIDYRL